MLLPMQLHVLPFVLWAAAAAAAATTGNRVALNGYRVWDREALVGHTDIYAPNTLAISHLDESGDVTGYYYSLETDTHASGIQTFARNACYPYTVVKWPAAGSSSPQPYTQGVISAGNCPHNGRYWHANASLLLLLLSEHDGAGGGGGRRREAPEQPQQQQRLFLPIDGKFTQVRYDYHTRLLYTYAPPLLNVYNVAASFERVRAYRLEGIQHFYVSNGVIFYSVNNTAYAYAEADQRHLSLGATPHGYFYHLYIYDTELAHAGAGSGGGAGGGGGGGGAVEKMGATKSASDDDDKEDGQLDGNSENGHGEKNGDAGAERTAYRMLSASLMSLFSFFIIIFY